MTTIKDVWVIIRGDFRADKLKLVWALAFSILLMGYMSLFMSLIFDETLGAGGERMTADFMLLAMIPMLGFTFSRRTMKYWSEDSYTRMLAYMRSLPVPAFVILCKRKLHAVISFALNGMLYFGLTYVLSGQIREDLSVPAYLVFALTWIGYGFILTGLYIFVELLVSGKAYCCIFFLVMLLSLGIALLIRLAGGNLFLYSIQCSKEWGFASPLMWGTLLLGTVSVQVFSKWTLYRLKSRDVV
ncbi:hypothetical protein [Paenibacillus sp. S150]|uniref:hypothetical protein n=1 Tax=Paenibacillus sp. S150 TaxID=2749826 RepID=UPI001C576592|nr:hypothetical protein [Paenibacillus sp. S150]MBW4084248.1 hypothetical protein [Paenibacillus sp. S150]